MRIAVGSDHRGVCMLSQAMEILRQHGHEVIECHSQITEGTIDYPEVGAKVGALVSKGEVDRGLLICGTGIGMSIVANKFPGVRAAVCPDELTAEISRRHNNLNVLCLSGDMLGQNALQGVIRVWLEIPFEHGRHERRIEEIRNIEHKIMAGELP